MIPRESTLMIRTALVYLVAGAMLGSAALAAKGTGILPQAMAWRAIHSEVMLAGWLLQFVIGVALWILPRLPGEGRERGDRAARVVWLLLNGGVLVAIAGVRPGGEAWLVVAGRVMVAAAALVFLLHAWPRARAYGMGWPRP